MEMLIITLKCMMEMTKPAATIASRRKNMANQKDLMGLEIDDLAFSYNFYTNRS